MNRPADSLEALREIENDLNTAAISLGEIGLRGTCIEARNKLHALRLAALTPQPPASGVPFDVVREVVRARTKLGFASPEGQEEQAARAVELIRELCEEVLAHNYATPTPAAVPDAVRGLVGRWRDEYAIRRENAQKTNWTLWVRENEAGRATSLTNCADELEAALSAAPDGEVRLWDSQWTNVVNHDNCYRGWGRGDAVAHAVKMTEKYIAENVRDGKLPPAKAAQQDGQL